MKNILKILLLVMPVIGISQTQNNSKIKLEGIWTLTDFNNPDKFEDTWQFTSDNIFNELKHKADGDETLVVDENGTWILTKKNLKITVTGEDTKGEQKLYAKPQVMEFEISKDGNDLILNVLVDGGASDGKTIKLRLTKK